jgi:ubiquitin carboxyl-terminal hydrolase 7
MRSFGSLACTHFLPRIHDLDAQGLYSNPIQFYDFLQNRVMLIFRPKFEEPDHDQSEFSLILSKKQNYDMVSGGCRISLYGS